MDIMNNNMDSVRFNAAILRKEDNPKLVGFIMEKESVLVEGDTVEEVLKKLDVMLKYVLEFELKNHHIKWL